MIYRVYSDNSRKFIASEQELLANGWEDGEYVEVDASLEADSWRAAREQYAQAIVEVA